MEEKDILAEAIAELEADVATAPAPEISAAGPDLPPIQAAELEAARIAAARKRLDEARLGKSIHRFYMEMGSYMDVPEYLTGWPQLDRELGGGLFPGLYILGAESSLGKTSFVLQMADQLATSGRDVLFFTLEQSAAELMAKSISRYTYTMLKDRTRPRLAKTTRGVLNGRLWEKYTEAEQEHIQKAIENYGEATGAHLYIFEGSGAYGVAEIRQAVEDFKMVYEEEHLLDKWAPPVVILDYLQILAPANPKATDKMNTDAAVVELRRLARDYMAPVVVISSVNRNSYSTGAALGNFKESGSIEYSSDVSLMLQFKAIGEADKDRNRKAIDTNTEQLKKEQQKERDMELVILKNRLGKTGAAVPFTYHCLFNYFEEDNGGQAPAGLWEDVEDEAADLFNYKRL